MCERDGAHEYRRFVIIMGKTNLTGKVWVGPALVREGGVINDVPMKHIELTVGHCILTRKMCVSITEGERKVEVQVLEYDDYQSL